jgi:hypothetical protein
VPPPLSSQEAQLLRDFVRFALGDGHLTAWEENFLNSLKHSLYRPSAWLSTRQRAIIEQLQDKLHHDRPDVPLPPIDPDGVEENHDPDGWPAAWQGESPSEDEESLDFLAGI